MDIKRGGSMLSRFLSIGVLIWPALLLMVFPASYYPIYLRLLLMIFLLSLLFLVVARCCFLKWMRITLFQSYSLLFVLIAGIQLVSQTPSLPIEVPMEVTNNLWIEGELVSDLMASGEKCRGEIQLSRMQVKGSGIIEGSGSASGIVQAVFSTGAKEMERGDLFRGQISKVAWDGWHIDVDVIDSSAKGSMDLAYGYSRGKLKEWAEFAGDSGGLVVALLDGDRSFVEEGVKRGYRNAGVSHLLALSGMHLGVISALLLGVLKPLLGKMKAWLVVVGVSWIYVWFAGASPSLVRSAIMATLLFAFRWKGGESPLGLVLALAFPLSLALQPRELDSPALILSYLALAGLLALQPTFTPALRWILPKKLSGALGAVYGAQGATFGWTYPNFGTFATGGLLGSLFLTPLTFGIMGIGSLSLFSWLSGNIALSQFFLWLLYPIYWVNEKLLIFFGDFPMLREIGRILLYFTPLILLLIWHFMIKYSYARNKPLWPKSRFLQLGQCYQRTARIQWTHYAKAFWSKFFIKPKRP